MMNFYKVKKEYQSYKGIRYFAVDINNSNGIQVCTWPGEERRGKFPYIGMTSITLMSFSQNWLGRYVERSTKEEFMKNYNSLDKIFKTTLTN